MKNKTKSELEIEITTKENDLKKLKKELEHRYSTLENLYQEIRDNLLNEQKLDWFLKSCRYIELVVNKQDEKDCKDMVDFKTIILFGFPVLGIYDFLRYIHNTRVDDLYSLNQFTSFFFKKTGDLVQQTYFIVDSLNILKIKDGVFKLTKLGKEIFNKKMNNKLFLQEIINKYNLK